MNKLRRIGVFGGTFDPIHQAHIDIARAARDQARLDTVLFVVSALPPHKRHEVDAKAVDRYAMVEAALAGEPGLEPCALELEREGPSYTADTLTRLLEAEPDAELFLILGEDSLADFPRWHEPERILQHSRLIVVPRPGIDAEIPEEILQQCQFLEFEERPESSTYVRERLRSDKTVNGLLPEPVQRLIRERGLYGAHR